MADLNRKMAEGHTVSDLDTVIDEVYGAHGDYDTLGDRLDDIDTIIDTAKLGIHYKGEVNYYSNLPTTGVSIGDAYTVKYAGSSGTTPDGTEYVWGTVSGTNQWINFSKDSYTKAEVDALLALKVDTAGTGLSKSGTTLNHSNSTTAKTTQGFAQIAYDAQGHITGSTAATTAQANAINSGIDSEKVAQVETNKNNILSIYNTGFAQKNVMHIVLDEVKAIQSWATFINNTITFGNLSVTFNDDNSITLNGSNTTNVAINFKDLAHINLPTNAVGAASANITLSNDIFFGLWGDSGVSNLVLNDGVDIPSDYASKYSRGFIIRVSANTVCNNVRIYPMVCDKALYQASPEVVPYALSNAELTAAVLPTGYTKPTSATGIFLQSGGYCKIGNICVVCLRFSDSSAIAANTVIFSGLPLPVKDSTVAADRILIAVANNKNIEMNITASGDIRLGGAELSGANDTITAFVVYLAQS